MEAQRKFRITQYVGTSGKVVGSRIEEYTLNPSGAEVPHSASMYSEDMIPALKEALSNIIIKKA